MPNYPRANYPAASCERTRGGHVRLVLDNQRGSPSVELTEAEARTLAAQLVVAASEDASRAAGQVADGIEIAETGHQLFTHIHKVAKKNGWVR